MAVASRLIYPLVFHSDADESLATSDLSESDTSFYTSFEVDTSLDASDVSDCDRPCVNPQTRRFWFMRRADTDSNNLVNLLRAASPAGADPHENPTSHLAPDGADPHDSPGPTSRLVPDVTQVPAPSTSHQGSFASVTCPICDKLFKLGEKGKPPPAFWHHINTCHICLGIFPPRELLKGYDRLMCSQSNCHWIYHSMFRNGGCQRTTGSDTRCGGTLVDPASISTISFPPLSPSHAPDLPSGPANPPTPHPVKCPYAEESLLQAAY